MFRKVLLVVLFFISGLNVFSQVSDEQVIQLIREAQAQGKSQQEITLLLAQKGVTQEQMGRIQTVYNSSEAKDSQSNFNMGNRLRVENGVSSSYENGGREGILDAISDNDAALKKASRIFGRNIFNSNLLTFEPQLNIPTPENYTLGPGDEVIIDVWGDSENYFRNYISSEGNILISGLGPIYLQGLTVKEADVKIRNEFRKIYAGIGSGSVFVNLSLGKIRSIKVNVMGEVVVPGTYTLPSLASVFHALYHAGGVNNIGSLRSIKIFRNNKQIANIDIYEYILEGKTNMNISLKDDDVIIVGPYINIVEIEGNVKRPMKYELKDKESISKVLEYAGGFNAEAYKKNLRVFRKSGREYQVYNIDDKDFDSFLLTDGDVISVDGIIPRYENKVEISGAVYREGIYAIDEDLRTLKQLIEKAEGITGDAFLNRAVLYREKLDLTLEVIPIDIVGILEGRIEDIILWKNDNVYIPSIFDLQEDYTITVKGAVGNPGTYKYVENMSLEDLVVQAGGLLESASLIKVEVARRIKNPKSPTTGLLRAQTFTLTLKDGLVIDNNNDKFILEPFDEINVRRSPGYQQQRNVFVTGEIVFDGEYTLVSRSERLSDLVRRAGGLTADSYLEGARLERRMTYEEKERVRTTMRLFQRGARDTIDVSQLNIGNTYYVGIELEKALKNPTSPDDIILREGDVLHIPAYNGTVKMNGFVMYPNTVVYKSNKKLKYYIEQAGGYTQRARKKGAYVIYMNGTVAKASKRNTQIKPGCEIIVPMKMSRGNMNLAEILSLTMTTTSMAAIVTSIVNSTK